MKVKVAAIQASPVYLDRDATIEKAAGLAAQAAGLGASLAVFPEAFVPTYPDWVWRMKPVDPRCDELFGMLVKESVVVPSPATEALGKIAADNGIFMVMGVNEREAERSGTVYNTMLYFGPDGTLLGKHRKLMPSSPERMVWGFGDGSTLLQVHDTPFGKVGGLLCWENYMPLARAAIFAEGVDIYCAPTWDRGENWIATLRHIAREGRCFVIGVSIANRTSDVPDSIERKEEIWPADAWIHEGWSAILAPSGEMLAGPAVECEEILVAELDVDQVAMARARFDVAGHYACPDVLRLTVNTRANGPVEIEPDGWTPSG